MPLARLLLPLAVGVALAPAAAAPAAAAARTLDVDGPRTVRVGEAVRLPTTGFKPLERITVNLVPTINRGGNCCGIDVIEDARADADGEAILRWRWPTHYFNGKERKRWRNGAKADVIVHTPAFARGFHVVRVYR